MARTVVAPAVRRWIEAEVGGRVVRTQRLTGGISAVVHRVVVDRPAGRLHVVLRQWPDGLADSTAEEARVLGLLEPTPVPAPHLLAATDGSATDGVPALLMTKLPGRIDLTPRDLLSWLGQLAEALVTIQAQAIEAPVLEPRPRPAPTDVPPWAEDRALWRAVLTVLQEPRPEEPLTFTHGDFQHFNVLWSRGRLRGVVDWVAPIVSSPDLDVGHCRLNLVILFGLDAAEGFRAAYEAVAGRRQHPWWDLHQLTEYDPAWWHPTIPVQVGGRRPVDIEGMTGRVEEALRSSLARL